MKIHLKMILVLVMAFGMAIQARNRPEELPPDVPGRAIQALRAEIACVVFVPSTSTL